MLLIHFARVNSGNEERKKDRKDIGIHIYADLATQLECVKRKIVAKDPPIILTRRISTEERYFLKKKKDSLTLNTDIVTLGTGAFFWRRKGGGNIFGQGVEGERVIELSSNRCGARRSLSLSLFLLLFPISVLLDYDPAGDFPRAKRSRRAGCKIYIGNRRVDACHPTQIRRDRNWE